MAPPPFGWASLPTEIKLIIWQYCIGTKLRLTRRKILFELHDLVRHHRSAEASPPQQSPNVSDGAAVNGCFCPGGGDTMTDKKMLGIVTSVRNPVSDSFFDLDYTPDPTSGSTTISTQLPFDRQAQLDVGEYHAKLQPFVTSSSSDVFRRDATQ
ncbi:predicted protein [Verticillium alfalfae VaMs.102]|uniref:Predicted protein n=1 Tax=Verticillium alfalfae (strain VaMs.102 / ATCC MYA-4576 / FGSC 10136) TaxID=526221 RepID=C9SU25_VERA1|nr:predicted protein [Verticillium alfalfae VaMs.102]EEY22336.1 predicted protein [Verticillium alfalfae VaMs.102]